MCAFTVCLVMMNGGWWTRLIVCSSRYRMSLVATFIGRVWDSPSKLTLLQNKSKVNEFFFLNSQIRIMWKNVDNLLSTSIVRRFLALSQALHRVFVSRQISWCLSSSFISCYRYKKRYCYFHSSKHQHEFFFLRPNSSYVGLETSPSISLKMIYFMFYGFD